MNHSTPGLPVHHQPPEFTKTHVHRVSDAIQPSHPLWFPSLPAPSPSSNQSLFNESTLHIRWPEYWSFSFSIISSKGIPGLTSFRMDWLDLHMYLSANPRLPAGWCKSWPNPQRGAHNTPPPPPERAKTTFPRILCPPTHFRSSRTAWRRPWSTIPWKAWRRPRRRWRWKKRKHLKTW